MLCQGYEKQFNVRPVSDLEAYCRQEDVSLLFIREPDKNGVGVKNRGISGMVLVTIFTKLMEYLVAVLGKRIVR